MSISPVEQALDKIELDLIRGAAVLDEDQLPDYPAAIAIRSANRATSGLRAVMDALGDLEPGPALIIEDALRRGLWVPAGWPDHG